MRLGFREDTRGVSALVGAVLLLGILVIALASYQAIIVPQQNAQTEFDHNQQVEDEMVEFRNALLEARLDERERATSVKLGTRYQSRTLAVNPPPATGTLQNISQSNMRVINESGDGAEILNLTGNEFFEYEPSYSEYRDAGTIRYENLLVYHEFTSSNVMLSDQLLVRGDTIRLVPSEPSINENGVDRVTYEPEPTPRRFVTVDNPQLTIPTKLSPEEWRGLIDDDDYSSIEEGENNDEIVITFEGQKRVIYSIVENQDLDKITEDDEDTGGTPGEVSPPPSVFDPDNLSFDGLPTAEADARGQNVDRVYFEFGVSNPNNVAYRMDFIVRVRGGEEVRLVDKETPGSRVNVELSESTQNDIDVEIRLRDQNGALVDVRSGRLTGPNPETPLT